MHRLGVAGRDLLHVVVARCADPPLDDLELAAVNRAGREDEAEQLVARLAPAVEIVGPRRHLGGDELDLVVHPEAFVVIRRVIRAAHEQAADAFLERGAVDVVRHADVGVLRAKADVGRVLPAAVERWARERTVDHGIGTPEQVAITVAIPVRQVDDVKSRHGAAAACLVDGIEQDEIELRAQRVEHALRDVAGRAGDHDTLLRHRGALRNR